MPESRVSDAVWNWQAGDEDDQLRGVDRKRVVGEFGLGFALGLVLFHVFHKAILGTAVFCVTGIVLVSGLFIPWLHGWIRNGARCLGKVAGIALSWILLAPFFYVFFTIGRLFLAVSGKDPLQRRFPGDEDSYWQKHLPLGRERYRRQH